MGTRDYKASKVSHLQYVWAVGKMGHMNETQNMMWSCVPLPSLHTQASLLVLGNAQHV